MSTSGGIFCSRSLLSLLVLVFSIFSMHVVMSDLLFLFITVISWFSWRVGHCIHVLLHSPRRINKEVIDTSTSLTIVAIIIIILIRS